MAKSLIPITLEDSDGFNSSVHAYFLFESLDLALMNLFSLMVEKHFFDEMRSKKLFGYTAYCSTKVIHNVWGYQFYVITSNPKIRSLQHCLEKFIDELEEFFVSYFSIYVC